MLRWLRHRRCLRRIADLEESLGIWPPWHFMRDDWYDGLGGGTTYREPRAHDLEHPPAWAQDVVG